MRRQRKQSRSRSKRPIAQQQHSRGTVYTCQTCGAPACFGFEVNRYASGRWFCAKHKEDAA